MAFLNVLFYLGTLCRITRRGKLAVQMYDGSGLKILSLHAIKPVLHPQFSLDQMPMTDSLLETWATLLSLTTYSHSFKTVPGGFCIITLFRYLLNVCKLKVLLKYLVCSLP